MLIKQAGHIMDIGFEKIFLMQNSLNISSSNVISTYVYEVGLLGADSNSFYGSIRQYRDKGLCILLVLKNPRH